ncbi:hypothetical protein Y1Q_0007846 [Alligator mississippiensis]|uniref:Uncharacterized protein n=1 Tax=Alligator mississippiensis TaxID=8496 RepID=A0A151NEP8_ALLMI|nr:hypothetical protein Y1Q_0007846 [Alligator mississippiensis]
MQGSLLPQSLPALSGIHSFERGSGLTLLTLYNHPLTGKGFLLLLKVLQMLVYLIYSISNQAGQRKQASVVCCHT